MRSILFFAIIIFLSIAMLYLFRPFAYPIFWAAVVAVMFHPMYTWIDRHLPTGISLTITLATVVITLLIPLTILGTLLVNESIDLYQTISSQNLHGALETAQGWFANTPVGPYIEQAKTDWPTYAAKIANTTSKTIFDTVKSITQNSFRFLFMLFIMFYTLFYFLKDGKRMLSRLMHFSPLGDTYEKMLYKQFTSTTRATLKSTLIVGGIQGLLGGILFLFAGIDGALIWGTIMVVLAIIPAVGPPLVLIPAGIMSLILGNVGAGILLLVGAFIISLIDNLIRPPLVGKDIQMHPLVVLFSTIGGILLFGISGFVIGPIIAALYTSIMSIYEHYYKNELENN
jgi:predicted PurR-regulated permease PerM